MCESSYEMENEDKNEEKTDEIKEKRYRFLKDNLIILAVYVVGLLILSFFICQAINIASMIFINKYHNDKLFASQVDNIAEAFTDETWDWLSNNLYDLTEDFIDRHIGKINWSVVGENEINVVQITEGPMKKYMGFVTKKLNELSENQVRFVSDRKSVV